MQQKFESEHRRSVLNNDNERLRTVFCKQCLYDLLHKEAIA